MGLRKAAARGIGAAAGIGKQRKTAQRRAATSADQRLSRHRRQLVAAVGFVERCEADAVALEQRARRPQRRFVRHFAQDQMGMLASMEGCNCGTPRSAHAQPERLVGGTKGRRG
jgi:hypothetical protein